MGTWPKSLDDRQEKKLQPEILVTVQPKGIVNGTMKSYQLAGLAYMQNMAANGAGCILGDEMGLGKTLQIISHITKLKEDGLEGPCLIVCPLGVILNWGNEMKRWAPHLKFFNYHGQGNIPAIEEMAVDAPFGMVLGSNEKML